MAGQLSAFPIPAWVRDELIIKFDGMAVVSDKPITPNGKNVQVIVEYGGVQPSDAVIDLSRRENLDTGLIQRKAREITEGASGLDEKIERLCGFVASIPIDPRYRHERITMPYESDFVLTHNLAKKCADKARLFVDMCRSLQIPSRSVSGFYNVSDPTFFTRLFDPSVEPHGWAAYFDGKKWRQADPTFGHCGEKFQAGRYFLCDRAIRLEGTDKFKVVVG